MKKFILFIAGIISTQYIDAQVLPFEVEIPNVKFIRSKNGVNIRQQPSVNAKKLIMDNNEDSEYGLGNLKWSSSLPRGYKALQFKNGVSFKEQEGWFFIENIGPLETGLDGWVSARYCETFFPEPINYLKTNYDGDCYRPTIKWISGTKEYKSGEYVLILEGGDDVWVPINIYLGKLSDGIIICPFVFPVETDWDSGYDTDSSSSYSLKQKSQKNNYGTYWYIIPPSYEGGIYGEETLKDSFVNDLLTKVEPEKLETPRIYYQYNNCLQCSSSPDIY